MELSKYEKARIIGARALQIAMGAPLNLKPESLEPIEISKKELEKGVMPITIKKPEV